MTNTTAKELWTIDIGNVAYRCALVLYKGTRLGAVRYAKRLWRSRNSETTHVSLRRPGCSPVLLMKQENGETIELRGMRFGSLYYLGQV